MVVSVLLFVMVVVVALVMHSGGVPVGVVDAVVVVNAAAAVVAAVDFAVSGAPKNGVADGTDYAKDRAVAPLMQYSAAKIGGDDKVLRR